MDRSGITSVSGMGVKGGLYKVLTCQRAVLTRREKKKGLSGARGGDGMRSDLEDQLKHKLSRGFLSPIQAYYNIKKKNWIDANGLLRVRHDFRKT